MNKNLFNAKTVIIGSGISGISTAINLLENNYDDFLIFEVNDRIGGRCFTIDYADSVLEYGAQFIHGQVDNPIYKIAIENNLIDQVYKDILFESDEDLTKHNGLKIGFEEKEIHHFLTENGTKLDGKLIEIAYDSLNKSIRMAERYGTNKEKISEDRSVGNFIYENYMKLIQEEFNPEDLNEETRKILDGIFQWRCRWENIENGCSSVFEMSLNSFCNFDELKGSQTMEIKKGYKSVLDCIIDKHKDKFYQREKENSQVSNCEHCEHVQDKNKIVLLINDNIVICNNVVCTMSLGYLKENITKIIQPSDFISQEKLLAISRFGFGTVNKIILVYDKPFWEKGTEGIHMIWLNENKQQLFDKIKHQNFDFETKWCEDICSFEPAINHDNVLIGWIGGNSYHEKLSDQEIIQSCTSLLRKFLARDDIPEPKDVIRSKWNTNPYYKGSYSYYPINSNSTDVELIAEPIILNNRPYVQFAGEATHVEYYSTVHGAFLTGLRESERIIKSNI